MTAGVTPWNSPHGLGGERKYKTEAASQVTVAPRWARKASDAWVQVSKVPSEDTDCRVWTVKAGCPPRPPAPEMRG